ncbi:hypothetical protein HPP92_008954 [Vanilla planifolia]|uniref:Fungal lipase-type domain-containing protein n=1 Tax=Vanilla planifolia TaxID=51239 RepID=A0A835R9D5_VANPL|nr:hypothetical protein HPP92_008954 [Vanilla planifolia]
MACTFVGVSAAAPPVSAMREIELCGRIKIRRTRSEPLLRWRSVMASREAPPPPTFKTSRSTGNLPFGISIRSLQFEAEQLGYEASPAVADEEERDETEETTKQRVNWVQRICEVGSKWRDRQPKDGGDSVISKGFEADKTRWEELGCDVRYESEEDEKPDWDHEAFGRLLEWASWTETKLFSKLAFLCNMAYMIPEIKTEDLRNYCGVGLVTTSLEKKLQAAIKAQQEMDPMSSPAIPLGPEHGSTEPRSRSYRSSVAYDIASSAASYIHNRAKNLFLGSQANTAPQARGTQGRMYKSKVATYVAASSVTAVVAAEEKARLEAASDLQSLHSSPCEWFVCDEPNTRTRCFVIQGSDSLASWQANLFFEPTEFEGMDSLVHRGIYEAAKGIYEQFMPEIESHLRKYGNRARFRFTGHSLGGSLALLISLMLISRSAVPQEAVLPVVTFGSPAVFCGGHRVLAALDLKESHVRTVMMHRDIVPRAFSCDYPIHVANVLKRLNCSFRTHPCLNSERLLYSPLGRQYILQPDEKLSPPHPMLPPGTALYVLHGGAASRSALRAFLNAPHPLETLSQPTAYGSEGTILRDHDSRNYVKAVKSLLLQHPRAVIRRPRPKQLKRWWPLLTAPTVAAGPLTGHTWPTHYCEHVKQVASRA